MLCKSAVWIVESGSGETDGEAAGDGTEYEKPLRSPNRIAIECCRVRHVSDAADEHHPTHANDVPDNTGQRREEYHDSG